MHVILDLMHSLTSHTTTVKILQSFQQNILIYTQKQLDANKTKARKAGAIETIVGAMKKHIGDAEICAYGCNALFCIINNACKTEHFFRIFS